MPYNIANIAANATNTAIGAGMGLMLGGYNDRRQINQQTKLQNLQIAGQKEMTDYNMIKQLEMWKNTNYEAQKEQMQKAGLNPALMYGMGGGGGQSMGNANGSVNSGNAPQGGGEAMGMGLAMANMQLMKAQKENIDADTENKKAEAGYTTGPKTENTQQNTKLQGEQKLKTSEEKDSLSYDNIIKDLLINRDEKGNIVTEDKDRLAFKQQAANYLKTTMESAGINQNIQTQVAQIAQKWKQLSLEERQVKLNEIMGKSGLDNKDQDQIIGVISMILNNLTHGIINIGRKPTQIHDNSYRPSEHHTTIQN